MAKSTKKLRKSENVDNLYIYRINIGLVGNPSMEAVIDAKLQSFIENGFLYQGEKVEYLHIESINNFKKDGK